MSRSRRFASALLAVMAGVTAPLPLRSQAGESSPEAAAEGLVTALRAGDWDAMAARMHPSALQELREFLDPLLAMPDAATFRQTLLRVGSAAEAQTMSNEALFARFMGFATSQDPDLLPSMRTAQLNVLGRASNASMVSGEVCSAVTFRRLRRRCATRLEGTNNSGCR